MACNPRSIFDCVIYYKKKVVRIKIFCLFYLKEKKNIQGKNICMIWFVFVFQNLRMPRPFLLARSTCYSTIVRNKTNRPTKSKSFQKSSWKLTHTQTFSANLKIKKQSPLCEGKYLRFCCVLHAIYFSFMLMKIWMCSKSNAEILNNL